MASATGIPEDHPADVEAREDEPLLGGPGDVQQGDGLPIYHNFLTGMKLLVRFLHNLLRTLRMELGADN